MDNLIPAPVLVIALPFFSQPTVRSSALETTLMAAWVMGNRVWKLFLFQKELVIKVFTHERERQIAHWDYP